jgi:hypothetical protein
MIDEGGDGELPLPRFMCEGDHRQGGAEGMPQARRMGTHSTEGQTADYVRHRKAQKTGATR